MRTTTVKTRLESLESVPTTEFEKSTSGLIRESTYWVSQFCNVVFWVPLLRRLPRPMRSMVQSIGLAHKTAPDLRLRAMMPPWLR